MALSVADDYVLLMYLFSKRTRPGRVYVVIIHFGTSDRQPDFILKPEMICLFLTISGPDWRMTLSQSTRWRTCWTGWRRWCEGRWSRNWSTPPTPTYCCWGSYFSRLRSGISSCRPTSRNWKTGELHIIQKKNYNNIKIISLFTTTRECHIISFAMNLYIFKSCSKWGGNPLSKYNYVPLTLCLPRSPICTSVKLPRSSICTVIHTPIVHLYCSRKGFPLFLVRTVRMRY